MAALRPKAVILGHSFVRRLRDDLRKNFDVRASASFALDSSLEVFLLGTGGLTVERLVPQHLGKLKSILPDIVILEIGTNDLGQSCRPEVVGSSIDDLVLFLREELKVKVVGVCLVIPRKLRKTKLPDLQFKVAMDILNQYLRVVLEGYSFAFVWEHRQLGSAKDVISMDGVHVNVKGQYLLYRSYRGALLKALNML